MGDPLGLAGEARAVTEADADQGLLAESWAELPDAIAQTPTKQDADRVQQTGLDQYQAGDRRAEALTLYSLGSARQNQQLLMNSFYENLRGGKVSISEALRQAQLTLIRGRHAHPYYWSPFILIGGGI